MHNFTILGQLVDVFQRRIYPARISVSGGRITYIEETDTAPAGYILPGFIDAHVHIESSMLVPTAFARMAVVHGTVATVSDPHEIANVCGVEGVEYMIANSKQSPFKFFFGAPSCVPATFFETAGAHLDAAAVKKLLQNTGIWYLAEMMNFPGVLHDDPEVMAKIEAAKKAGKPVDGHAPGLRGKDVLKYASAGITTDHECFTIEEAKDKLEAGMKIIIREGSAARNFDALAPLFGSHADRLMFCSDDKHPDELVLGHINELVKRALMLGYDLFDVLRAASVNPVEHYGLPVGLLRMGDPADFIIVNDLDNLQVIKTYINGVQVAANGTSLIGHIQPGLINNFSARHRSPEDFRVKATTNGTTIRVIEALDGQLVTNEVLATAKTEDGYIVSDTENDILKIVVVNRYEADARVATAFIKNMGIKKGALASTVAHDCHNIIAVGADDEALAMAVNALVDSKGGIAVTDGTGTVSVMPLPIGGLMSDADGHTVAEQYAVLDRKAKELGSQLRAPFMTLSFMALLVIPSLKLSDKGLFNGSKFEFTATEVS